MEVPEKFKEMMENESDEDDELEKICEAFICCVCRVLLLFCRDLLYKPVVLACGHISCFWCIHKSMSGLHKSRCPICRNQYYHFPYICQKLHLLLLKMYPSAYKRRENQTLEEEKDMGYFSPQIGAPEYQLQPEPKIIKPSNASVPCFSETDSSLNPCSVRAGETLDSMEHVHSGSVHQDIGLGNLLESRKDTAATSAPIAEDRNSNQIHRSGTCKQASVDDVLCDSCNHMLFRPIVLNCGHAFCICCIVPQTSEMLKCQVCQSPHPGDIPKVCLEFDHFLEEQFPKEYGLKREALQMKHEQFLSKSPSTCSSEAGKESFHFSFSSGEDPLPWWNASSKVHIGVGCDACGMYPIIGDRYRCKDCVEQIGYDLCKDCYSTRSKLPGRFNQQHTSEHKFEIVKSNAMHNIMLRLLRGQLQEVSAVSDALHDTSASAIPSSDNTNEDEENVADATRPSSETEPNESENQRLA
ncbi:E3 ubiquitin-protein ligase PRT1 isoform X1 [Sesamum indicum]|uniref:E3 ubiquitin-protein ligase PRT1 isoform X1 n=1 Tax=Sesamum indicum TaxID=4182 RepID=A0A6I9T7I8_SESIN|nr:E3 ubiquitin-protein ligase PRT1 isoform X1 [Sesamum indicum]XP_011080194.1 E3 ubiquitin-protein ligase PRT1 isoform X1 [Sesamum indicum]